MSAHDYEGVPRAALWLLRHWLPESEREALIGDLLEEAAGAQQNGLAAARARRRFWRETIVALLTVRGRRGIPAPEPPSGDPPVMSFLADLAHGVRLLRRAPAFTLFSVITLGLGIGATTAIFSVANPVLLQPLPYPNPERIVAITERDADGSKSNTGFATFTDLAREARTLERASAFGDWIVTLSATANADAEQLAGQRVSSGYFSVLGVRPMLGRDFTAEEDTPDRNKVVILDYGLWRRRFGGDSSIVGRTILLDGAAYTVVGVLPPAFDNVLDPRAHIWRVLGYSPALPWACRTCRHLSMIGRMKAGVTREQTLAELNRLSALLVKQYPREYPASGTYVDPLQDRVTAQVRPMLLALFGAVALVLLIAAANVASLQLARAVRREDEFAIRAALGAGRVRLGKQLLAEGLVLATLGGAAGLLVAQLSVGALVARLPATLPRLTAVRLDGTALAVAGGVTLLLGVIVGLVPMWHGGRRAFADSLRGAGRQAGPRRRVARAGLVVLEVALALTLLVGAGLLSRSLLQLMAVDSGFVPSHLLTLNVQATGPKYPDSLSIFANHDRVRAEVSRLPGVVSVGTINQLPLGGNMDAYSVHAEDKPLANPELAPFGDRYVVSGDFMKTMGIRILRGRGFESADLRDSTPPVTILSAALAAKIWGNADPLGKRVRMGGLESPSRTVIGIAGNVHHRSLDTPETYQFYVPERQWRFADNQVTLVVRTGDDPVAMAQAVRRVVHDVDPTQPITGLATMDEVVASSTSQRRLALIIFLGFATTALLLAAAGIYGVLAGAVAERTREIGVRSALGATPRDLLRMVLLDGARLAGTGLVAGLVAALLLGRFLERLLFGVRPADPITLASVALLLGAVAFVACLVPALRAVRVDPLTALRAD